MSSFLGSGEYVGGLGVTNAAESDAAVDASMNFLVCHNSMTRVTLSFNVPLLTPLPYFMASNAVSYAQRNMLGRVGSKQTDIST